MATVGCDGPPLVERRPLLSAERQVIENCSVRRDRSRPGTPQGRPVVCRKRMLCRLPKGRSSHQHRDTQTPREVLFHLVFTPGLAYYARVGWLTTGSFENSKTMFQLPLLGSTVARLEQRRARGCGLAQRGNRRGTTQFAPREIIGRRPQTFTWNE